MNIPWLVYFAVCLPICFWLGGVYRIWQFLKMADRFDELIADKEVSIENFLRSEQKSVIMRIAFAHILILFIPVGYIAFLVWKS